MSGSVETYRVRAMRASDLDTIVRLEQALFGKQAWSYAMLAEELGGPGRWYIVVTHRDLTSIGPDTVIGYAGLWFDGEVTQIMTVGVDVRHQGNGAGSILIEALVSRSVAIGAEAVLLEVAVGNDPALRLYGKYGFEQLGIRKRYYQPGDIDAVVMRLDLTDRYDKGQDL
ncbi:ribosomal protein S18-alanine N-acetyltransferase [Rarobacter incanus]|uniref:Ribosomal-protein-alanine N-acetyltransferase n=1 Tax=Rarobacter incanus TaxID=153494 RepID=A0A542SR53_9MICO|nr:ribosomal protein S18-alanine N-acetyltransferase [Rarobacter incanus]TQK77099.1 ribosomal-protein-alanine N-acetyltransferase [Rarobacter incanus]